MQTHVQFPIQLEMGEFALGALPVLDDEFDAEASEDVLHDELRDVLRMDS